MPPPRARCSVLHRAGNREAGRESLHLHRPAASAPSLKPPPYPRAVPEAPTQHTAFHPSASPMGPHAPPTSGEFRPILDRQARRSADRSWRPADRWQSIQVSDGSGCVLWIEGSSNVSLPFFVRGSSDAGHSRVHDPNGVGGRCGKCECAKQSEKTCVVYHDPPDMVSGRGFAAAPPRLSLRSPPPPREAGKLRARTAAEHQ